MKLAIGTVGVFTSFLVSVLSFASPGIRSVTATTASDIPDNLRPSSNEQLSLTLIAKGVQIYQCQAKKDNGAEFEWNLKAPEADLFDGRDNKVGKHYVGPVWESNDGSKVFGKVKAKADAKEPNAIPWLLLDAKKVEGNGVFSKVTSIQRLDTVGGKAPTTNCNKTDVDREVRIPYTATYNFYTSKP
jgi:Protein of unknown function (DUF3455)